MSQFAPKSILCPLDLSSASPIILRWASLIAGFYNSKLQVLHAEWMEYPRYFLPSQAAELAAESERARTSIRDDLQRLVKETIPEEIPREITVMEGHPIEKILEYAERHRPDLIVMGSHGRSGVARMRMGSVAENVVQQTSCPTLVVHAPGGKPAPSKISGILCPVIFDEHSAGTISLSAALAGATGAHLIVMHVEEADLPPEVNRKQLCESVPSDARAHCDVVEVVRQGSAAEQILHVAREYDVDIIARTAKHRRFLDFTVIGTTTEKVMRHADSAVLVVPAQEHLLSSAG